MAATATGMPDGVELPDAVRQQAEEAQAREADIRSRVRTGRPSETPAAATETPAPSPAPDTQPSAGGPVVATAVPPTSTLIPGGMEQQVRELMEERVALRQRLARLDGTVGGTVAQLKAQVGELSLQIAQLLARGQTPPAAAAGEAPQPAGATAPASTAPQIKHKPIREVVPEENYERFGEAFYSELDRVSSARVQESIEQILATLEPRRGQDATVDSKIAALEERLKDERYWAEVERLAPGAIEINGGTDAAQLPAEGWPDYLEEPVTSGCMTRKRQEALLAIQNRNAERFADMVNDFKRKHPDRFGSKPSSARQSPAQQVVPPSSRGDTPPVVPAEQRRIPESEIKGWQQRCAKEGGKIPFAEVNARTKEYQAAYAEGRVLIGQ